MNQGSPICFGDVIKLHAASAFAPDGAVTLSFMEQAGKDQPLLMVPPKDAPADAKFMEAEFIVAPVRGEKQQPPGTSLTYKTPFTLRTTETDQKSKKEMPYSLNNKVSSRKDGVTLQPALVKGEMFLTFEKEGFTPETIVHENDTEFQLVVVDSNRIRKTLNHPLGHFTKPKVAGAFVGCGLAKNSKPLTFSMSKVKTESGKTRSYIQNAKVRRATMDALEPAKLDELGRPDRIDSDASEMEARSRHGSLVSQPSTSVLSAPASPTAAATASTPSSAEATTGSTTNTPPASEPVERSAASEREAEHSTAVLAEAATTLHVPPAAAPLETPEAAKLQKTSVTSAAAPAPESLPAMESATETPAETTSTAEVVISEAFTTVSEAPASATMATVSSTTAEADELDADVGNDKAACVGGIRCSIM